MIDYYQVLGLKRTASAAAIRSAWQRLMKQFHPDRGGDAARASEILKDFDYEAWQPMGGQFVGVISQFT